MKLLVLCDEGNNRSVTLAHQLKYLDHDVLAAGLKRNSPETIDLLCSWADKIITTDIDQHVPAEHADKTGLWFIGPDNYPRPFNKELLAIVRRLIEQHRADGSI